MEREGWFSRSLDALLLAAALLIAGIGIGVVGTLWFTAERRAADAKAMNALYEKALDAERNALLEIKRYQIERNTAIVREKSLATMKRKGEEHAAMVRNDGRKENGSGPR